jgi:hypothetical protein
MSHGGHVLATLAYPNCFCLNSEGRNLVPEPCVKKHRRNKEVEDRLAKEYGDIGFKAVAAAVEPTNKAVETAKPVSTKANRESE